MMTPAQAKESLLIHSFGHPDMNHPKMERGFLGSLRPYRGALVVESFHEVMAALRVLAPTLQQPTVDREVVGALWHICHLAQSWGIHPDGMLRRNGLIQPQDIERLERWVSCISHATMILLGGGGPDEAFSEYDRTGA